MADQIEAATGMDFDRFTRSMLLAQGGFAVFLQAAPDERAPILEQITGTEIYSQISIRVHERRSEERKKLDTLQAQLSGMQLLTPEEEQQLAESLEQKVRQDTELTQRIARKNQAIIWIEGIARLEDALKALGQAKDEVKARTKAFSPEQAKLDAATRALELAADYAALTASRKHQEADRRSMLECRESLPGRIDTAKQAEGVMKAAAERLDARKSDQQKALPVIRKVRELDLKIAEKDVPIQAANDSIVDRSTSLDALKAEQKSDSDELGSKRKALTELQPLLETSKVDGELVEHLAGLRGRFEALKVLNGHLVGKREEVMQAGNQFREATKAWQEQTTCLENAKRGLDGAQGALTEKQGELLKILEHREVAEWRKSLSLLAAQERPDRQSA